MGIFAIALSIVGLLSIVRSLGLGSYLIRAADLTHPLKRTLFTINGVLAITVSLAILLFSLLGDALLREPGVEDLLRVMAILPLTGIFDFIPAASIERRGEFRLVAIVNVFRYSLSNAATLAFAYAGHGYMSLAYGQVVSAFASVVHNNLFARDSVVLSLGLQGWRDVMRFGTQVLAISAIAGLQGRIAELVLAKFLGLAAFGLYSHATSLTGVLWENIQIIVLRVLFVDFAEQKRQGIPLRHSYLRLMQVLTGFLWPIFLGIGVVSGPLVLTLFGEKWLDAVMPLSILSISAALFVPIMVAYNIFVISNEAARQIRLKMLRAPVSLAIFALGCLVSLEAAAATKVMEAVIMYLVYRPHLERMTETRWADYVSIYGRSLLLVVAAVLPAALVMQFYTWLPQAPLPMVLAGVAAGGLAWTILLWALRHPLFEEGARLLSKLLRQPRVAAVAS